MSKSEYQPPKAIMLGEQFAYGSEFSPLGQCNNGASPQGSDVGCQSGTRVVDENCVFGQFPTSSVCVGGSDVGFANQCATGLNLT